MTMNFYAAPLLALALLLAPACGDGDSKTDDSSGSDTSTTATATDPVTTGTTGMTGTTATTATDDGTSTDGTGTATGTATGTTDTPTSEPTSTSTTEATSTSTSTTEATSTTGEEVDFTRFELTRSAGPCPPNADCDGFIELLASRMLRVEKFGEVGNPVIEVEISEADFTAAVLVFADPALAAVLDGADPLCEAPTDIFETMLVEQGGSSHDATTTACDQAPLNAARDKANALAMQYAP